MVSLDFIVQLSETKIGFDSITVFVDKLTKMVHMTACRTTDTTLDVEVRFPPQKDGNTSMAVSVVWQGMKCVRMNGCIHGTIWVRLR